MKKYIYSLAFTATALFATACSDEEVNDFQQIPDSQKEMISFSMSDGANTRTAQTRAGFTANTKIVMRIQSDKKDASDVLYTRTVASAGAQHKDATTDGLLEHSDVTFSSENGNVRYWDDAFGRDGQLSVYAVAVANKSDDTLLPVYTLKDGSGAASTTNVSTWGSSSDNKLTWSVETDAQTTATIGNKDLVYSNNIQADGTLGKSGVYRYDFEKSQYLPDLKFVLSNTNKFENGRMVFSQASGAAASDAGKFDKGHMDFKHALTRMTIELIEGAGYNASVTTDFQFTMAQGESAVTNIKLLSVPYKGTFDVKTGAWTSPTTGNIAKLAPLATYSDAKGSYQAQFLPGYSFGKTSTENVFTFTIDNNTYYVTQKMIFEALTKDGGDLTSMAGESSITMEQGKNYKIKITVNKTKIESISATLVDWVDVTSANENVYNSYVTLSLRDETGTACEGFDIYRLPVDAGAIYTTNADSYVNKAWGGNYTDVAKTGDNSLRKADDYSTSKKWQTTWFFNDNKTFYHFRTVNAGTTINTTPNKNNFTITSGAVATTDPHWGAPMVSGTYNFKYEETEATDTDGNTKEGYSAHIYKAIGSTKDNIAITEIHMMANVKVVLKTVSGDGAVKLYDETKADGEKATKVTITQFANAGTVDMGTGFVRPTSPFTQKQLITAPGTDETTYYSTPSTVSNEYSWAVVPQALQRGNADADYIGITIQTPDANQYYVVKKLSEIVATSIKKGSADYTDPNQNVNDAVKFWYPGHQYIYTFTISKKGIEAITCTVADWVTVTAANKDITLED